MSQHDPGFIKNQDGRIAVHGLLNAMKQVGQNRDQVLVAQVHQLLDLKDHEGREAQGVGIRVQQPPHGSLHSVVLDGFLDFPILHHMIEVGQRAQVLRVGRQAVHGRVNGVAMRRHDREAL